MFLSMYIDYQRAKSSTHLPQHTYSMLIITFDFYDYTDIFFLRATSNVQDASVEETEEILAEINNLSDDDLSVVSVEKSNV